MVETTTPIRLRKKKTTRKRERRYTSVFHMENDTGEKITVYQKYFLSTLTTDKTIQTVLSKSEGSRTISDVSDKRGKRIPGNKISNDISDKANSHILRFNPSISHYRKKHAPKIFFISPEFNVSMVSYTYYYTIL